MHELSISNSKTEAITLNSTYNDVTFNEKLAKMKENLYTKYAPFTYNDITFNKKSPITKQNVHLFFPL